MIKSIKLVIILSLNLVIGALPSKIIYFMLLFTDSFIFNLMATITNILIFISYGNNVFINIFFNDGFYDQFLKIIGKNKSKKNNNNTKIN